MADKKVSVEEKDIQPVNPLFTYDKALYKKIKSLYDETYYIDTYENAFEVNAKAHEGKVLLPMISIYRLGDYSIAMDMYNDVAVRDGVTWYETKGKAEFPDQRVAMHILPVTLQYQIDVWATRRDVVDGLTAELLMEFKERPHFSTKIQDMGKKAIPIEFDFLIDENVTDNSSITEFDEEGRFYRLTLTGNVPSAFISRVDTFPRIEKVEINIKDFNRETYASWEQSLKQPDISDIEGAHINGVYCIRKKERQYDDQSAGVTVEVNDGSSNQN